MCTGSDTMEAPFSLMQQYQMGVSALAHILHVVVKGSRFLPSYVAPSIPKALFCLHAGAEGKESMEEAQAASEKS